MPGFLAKAFGYQGDNMNLPVADLDAALPFYQSLGFTVVSRSANPQPTAVLARDGIQIGLTVNGGDPTNDGCAFHVDNLPALFDEFHAHGLGTALSAIGTEQREGAAWQVFFVVAPDGLCYWFGERQPT